MTEKLTTNLRLAPLQLYVADLAKLSAFYGKYAGLEVFESSSSRVTLGHQDTPIIELVSKSKLQLAPPNTAGLFHNAILYQSRGDLSKAVFGIATNAPQTFSGTGDHLVSEAFYFTDPEGNGLELYYDLPREQWIWEDGQIKMDTLYIDPNQYLQTHLNESSSKDKKLGHVHLRVGNIEEAKLFYIDKLGFEVTAQMPSALFMSVAGYHHHIAVNTWMSLNAKQREITLGLSKISIQLASNFDVTKLAERLNATKWPFTYKNDRIHTADPWGNKLVFSK